MVGFDHDVVPLSNSERKLVGDVGLDRDKVGGHDSERVLVKRYVECAVHGGVDEPDPVFLALSDGHFGILASTARIDMSAVHEDIIGFGRALWRVLCNLVECRRRDIIVVCDGESTKIHVVVSCSRSFDDYRPKYAIAVLGRKVRVIPGRAELGGLEFVLSRLSRSNWAFGNSRNTVMLTAIKLTDTMPMDTGSIVSHVVLDIDNNGVTPFRPDRGTRILAVDDLKLPRASCSIRVRSGYVGNLKVVLAVISVYVTGIIEKRTVTVVPAGGAFASKSVDILYPSLQHCRVLGVFVQGPSCLSIKEAGIAPTNASELAVSQ